MDVIYIIILVVAGLVTLYALIVGLMRNHGTGVGGIEEVLGFSFSNPPDDLMDNLPEHFRLVNSGKDFYFGKGMVECKIYESNVPQFKKHQFHIYLKNDKPLKVRYVWSK